MHCARILICALAIVAPAHAREPNKQVTVGCTRICSHRSVAGPGHEGETKEVEKWYNPGEIFGDDDQEGAAKPPKHVVTDPQCHQRCQADIYNCIESTLPKEEASGERVECIQDALFTRIREDGDIVTKLTYDVEPTFHEFDELYQTDGRFDSRDMEALKRIVSSVRGHGADDNTLDKAKVLVVMSVFNEADQDGDGVINEGEFNAYAADTDHISHKKEDLLTAAAPNLLAKNQSVFRSPVSQHVVNSTQAPQNFFLKKLKRKQFKLTYFQHLLHLGLRIFRDDQKLTDPIEALALKMYWWSPSQGTHKSMKKKIYNATSSNKKEFL